jgi:hypothetical protein
VSFRPKRGPWVAQPGCGKLNFLICVHPWKPVVTKGQRLRANSPKPLFIHLSKPPNRASSSDKFMRDTTKTRSVAKELIRLPRRQPCSDMYTCVQPYFFGGCGVAGRDGCRVVGHFQFSQTRFSWIVYALIIPSMDGPYAKLRWAKKHFDALWPELAAFCTTPAKSYTLTR